MAFTVTGLVPDFVGQIDGFPFHTLDPQTVRALRAAWTTYPVLRFRNVSIGDAEQVAFTRTLGRPSARHPKHLQEAKHDGFPEIFIVSNKKNADGSPAGDLGDGEVTWHTDTWFVETPPSAAILRAVELPPSGGNTYFIDMYAAYATLPEAVKARLGGLSIHHQSVVDIYGEVRLGKERQISSDFASWPGVDHPIVRRHPVSGKPCLYLGSARDYQSIVGMAQQEAKGLLDALWQHALERSQIWTQVWMPGDMIMWDNRCVMHRREAFDPNTLRVMHRTTVEGERPLAAV